MYRKDYKHEEITGQDVSIEVSLNEYGLAWIVADKDTLFYYGTRIDEHGDFDRFDFCTIENDTDVFTEYDWADFDEVLSFTGLTKEEFKSSPLTSKIADLLSYYGKENVFGGSYYEGLEYSEIVTD